MPPVRRDTSPDPVLGATTNSSHPALRPTFVNAYISRVLSLPLLATLPHLDAPSIKKVRVRKGGHIPRPPNSFIIFRGDILNELHANGHHLKDAMRHVSEMAGSLWKNVPHAVRGYYEGVAGVKKIEHEIAYPGYKYKPVRGKAKDRAQAGQGKKVRGKKQKGQRSCVASAGPDQCPTTPQATQAVDAMLGLGDDYNHYGLHAGGPQLQQSANPAANQQGGFFNAATSQVEQDYGALFFQQAYGLGQAAQAHPAHEAQGYEGEPLGDFSPYSAQPLVHRGQACHAIEAHANEGDAPEGYLQFNMPQPSSCERGPADQQEMYLKLEKDIDEMRASTRESQVLLPFDFNADALAHFDLNELPPGPSDLQMGQMSSFNVEDLDFSQWGNLNLAPSVTDSGDCTHYDYNAFLAGPAAQPFTFPANASGPSALPTGDEGVFGFTLPFDDATPLTEYLNAPGIEAPTSAVLQGWDVQSWPSF